VPDLAAFSEATGWFGAVWDRTTSIEPAYLLLGCALQGGQTVLNGVAWRNILRAAYPDRPVPTRPIVSAYAGGVGLNAFLPAQAGTIAYLGMFRAIIPDSRMVTLTAGTVVQNLFYAVASAAIVLFAFLARPGSASASGDRATVDGTAWLIMLALAAVVLVLAGRFVLKRLRTAWEQVKEGLRILRSPGRYLREVLAVQVAAYVLRMGVTATFLRALDIPVTLRNVLLVIAATAISSTVAITPGGIGTQQALASVALRDVAPAHVVTAYSLSQQAVITVFNIAFGLALLVSAFGWSATRDVVRKTRRPTTDASAG